MSRQNIAAATALIRQAAAQGAELIATPEMTTLLDRKPGAAWEKSTTEEADPGLDAFRALARELGVTLLIGSIAIRAADGKCANRSFLIGPDGEVIARYDKIHMFDVQLNAGQHLSRVRQLRRRRRCRARAPARRQSSA